MDTNINNRGWDNLHPMSKALYKATYFLPNEDYDGWLDRISTAYQNDDAHGERMRQYIHNYWFHPSTPVASNGGTDRGLPISCFTMDVKDTKEGIFGAYEEANWLGAYGGGIGKGYSHVRSVNEPVGSHGGSSSGVIPFMGVDDRASLAVSQGGLRRASIANYLHISHPEIEEFLDLRKPTGDQNRRAPNLHHGVVITDAFMEAVVHGDSWDLISPKSGEVIKTVDARTLWSHLLEVRATLKGEPYLLFIDTVNEMSPEEYKNDGIEVTTSNLCVTGDTKVLTKDFGYVDIASVAGKSLDCWNGKEWSYTELFKTSDGQEVLEVKLSNNVIINATPYHKWYVMDGYSKQVEKRTHELKAGDKLVKFDLEPIPHGTDTFPLAYTNGFLTGDGTVGKKTNKPRIDLHDGKQLLLPRFSGYSTTWYGKGGRVLCLNYKVGVLQPKFYVPDKSITVSDRLAWLAGYIDADGTLTNNNGTESIQVTCVELDFLRQVMLLLQELGVHSTVSDGTEARYNMLPLNDGTGDYGEFWCRKSYRLLIAGSELNKLLDLGFSPSRVIPTRRHYQRQARQFIQVVDVTSGGEQETFCCTEPKEHKVMFNGVLTGQCSEITLRTDDNHSGVCCLGSINLEHWEEYQPIFSQFIADCSDFLDNVLQDFIDRTDGLKGFERARQGAIDERSIGLGVMGFHSLLQSKMIPFESPMAKGLNLKVFSAIKEAADKHNLDIGELEWCPLSRRKTKHNGYGNKRNTHVTAIAPTMSISSLCNVASSGIEPWVTNSFVKKVKQGSFPIRNKYLAKVIDDYYEDHLLPTDWVDEQWESIKKNDGSVQHLDWMEQNTKDVFKTSFEIDQRYVVDLAGDRQPYIDQAQSVNLFVAGGSDVQYISDLHILAWKKKLKSLYYLRSSAVDRASTASNERKQIQVKEVDIMEDSCPSCG